MGELASGLLDDILEGVDVSLDRARALLRAAAPAGEALGSGAAAALGDAAAPVAGILLPLCFAALWPNQTSQFLH